ncbi:ABC transporter ATP-binding protein [Psychrilyobacter atlanticus]|uniref:ABC transporter ATP-binding protein n=1 Tax=Psychrilyobacter atlanticus TaxID=271091 RepID=UPI00041C3911|nr:ABC transporter ATP-binding protein [Psychrilyobacter atlanticus]
MIDIKKINYSIDGTQILDDLSFKFEKGKFYGILGPNGSGKTTFLDILSGYKNATESEIYIEKKELKEYSHLKLAKKIAIVPQKFDIVFPFSVSDILEMGRYPYKKKFFSLQKKDYEIIDKVIKEIGLEEFLDKEITTLSGGEEQRVIFGKALIQTTPILFLDESTSNLDPYYSHTLLSLVRKRVVEEQTTVIGVFHDFNLASLYCDEILLLEKGRIVTSGKTQDVLNSKKLEEVFKIGWEKYKTEKNTFVFPRLGDDLE